MLSARAPGKSRPLGEGGGVERESERERVGDVDREGAEMRREREQGRENGEQDCVGGGRQGGERGERCGAADH